MILLKLEKGEKKRGLSRRTPQPFIIALRDRDSHRDSLSF
jgi:hypothetical protein